MLDVFISGQALTTFGFSAYNTQSGIGLNTFGLVWDCADIWAPDSPSITTTWVACGGSTGAIDVCVD